MSLSPESTRIICVLKSIEAAAQTAIATAGLRVEVRAVDVAPEGLSALRKSAGLAAGELVWLIVPQDWARHPAMALLSPDEKLRIGFLGEVSDTPLPVVGTFSLRTASDLRIFVYGNQPGVSALLEEGAEIFNDRIASVKDIGAKIDRFWSHLEKSKAPSRALSARSRLAVSSLFAAGLDTLEVGQTSPRAPHLQAGGTPNGLAFSIRYTVSPEVFASDWPSVPFPVNVAARFADGLWLRLYPASQEVEILIRLDAQAQTGRTEKSLNGWELFEPKRIASINASADRERAKKFVYRNFQALPVKGETAIPAEAVAEPAPESKAAKPNLETITLQKKVDELQGLNDRYKQQIGTLGEQLQKTIAREKVLQKENRDLLTKVSEDAQARAESALQKEVETLKGRLASAKERETEMARKLTACGDEIARLREELKGRKAS